VIEADFRERNAATAGALAAAGATVAFVSLKTGDYRVGRSLLVERKTARDFWQSIFDGRLFRQAGRLAKASPRALLLVEGPGLDLSKPPVRGALVTLMTVFGVPVLFSRDAADSAQWILMASRHLESRKEDVYKRGGWRPKGKRARQLFILQGLPGIGPRRAEALLNRFGTVRGVFAAEEAAFREAPGIGNRTAQKIAWVLS
jgi:ERCC4-type nuclease